MSTQPQGREQKPARPAKKSEHQKALERQRRKDIRDAIQRCADAAKELGK